LQDFGGILHTLASAWQNTNVGRELTMMHWGMLPPPRTGGPPVTNIRTTTSPHWRMWLTPESRCLVPGNSFAECALEPNPETKKKDVVWFALDDDGPLFAFAGIWTTFNGRPGHQVEADSGAASGLRIPNDLAERGGRTNPLKGDAGDPDHG